MVNSNYHMDIDIDVKGNVWAMDRFGNNIQLKFDASIKFLLKSNLEVMDLENLTIIDMLNARPFSNMFTAE